MIWLYRLGYALLWLFSWLTIPFSPKTRKALLARRGLGRRWESGIRNWDTSKSRLWFHVSSAGELEQAYPLLDSLKKSYPNIYIALSFFSPSAERAIQSETSRRRSVGLSCSWDFADYSPFDFPQTTKHFLEILKPNACFLIHRELWPEMLFQAHNKNIPSFLLAAVFAQNQKVNKILRYLLRFLDGIITVDEESFATIRSHLTQTRLDLLGDPRWGRVLERKTHYSQRVLWKEFFAQREVFIGASLWDRDFQVLEQVLPSLLVDSPHLSLILVPHEPTPKRIKLWQARLRAKGISTRKWSHWLQSPDMVSNLIVDEVGFLAELYQISQWVFVGGSFKRKIHNVLEPLAHGAMLFSGPMISNSSEAKELSTLGLLKVAHTEEELRGFLKAELAASPQRRKDLKQKGQALLESKKRVSEKYVTKLAEWIAL